MSVLTAILTWLSGTGLGISTIVALVLSLLLKVMPRDKLWAIVKPSAIFVGFLINNTLLKLLSKKDAVKVEEGVICTLTYVGRMWFQQVETTVLEDNVKEVNAGDAVVISPKISLVEKINPRPETTSNMFRK